MDRHLTRALTSGLATGARSTLGLVPAALRSGRRGAVLGVATLVLGEATADKLPAAPSRLEPGPLGARIALGALGAGVLAHREEAPVVVPALVGAVGAALGSYAGSRWRAVAADRGWTWQAALAEDAAAAALGAAAWRRPGGSSSLRVDRTTS